MRFIKTISILKHDGGISSFAWDVWIANFACRMYHELKAYLSYQERHQPLTFWRSVNGQEVDFLLGDQTAIETKATLRVTDRDLKGLWALAEENVFKRFFLVSQDPVTQTRNGVVCLHWQMFLEKLWAGEVG